MEENLNGTERESFEFQQLRKYARALSDIYRSEKDKRREIENSHSQLMKYASALNTTNISLQETNKALREAYLDTIKRLSVAAEYKDATTGTHIARITRFSLLMVKKLDIPKHLAHNISYAASMHDIGKIGIPDMILLKPGPLTKSEYEIMKTHTSIGASILGDTNVEILQTAGEIALTHHEKWDGSGYPNGISGDNIPLSGRIVSIIDVFDALISQRPYKKPYSPAEAWSIMKKERGKHFDPEIVDIFLDYYDKFLEILTDDNVSIVTKNVSFE